MIRYIALHGGERIDLDSTKISSVEFVKVLDETVLKVTFDTGKSDNYPWGTIKKYGD